MSVTLWTAIRLLIIIAFCYGFSVNLDFDYSWVLGIPLYHVLNHIIDLILFYGFQMEKMRGIDALSFMKKPKDPKIIGTMIAFERFDATKMKEYMRK